MIEERSVCRTDGYRSIGRLFYAKLLSAVFLGTTKKVRYTKNVN